MNKSGYPRWTSVSTKITLSWSQISKKWRTARRVPSTKQDSHKLAVCSGVQRFVRERQPKLFAEERNLVSPNSFWKSVLWEGGLFLTGGELDGARGPTAGCKYPSLNVWPRWRKDSCRIFSGWFCLEINTVFQFHGCHWHSCPKCYPTKRKKLVTFETP